MPGRDGTGPLGMGPMTGRAAGNCAGYPNPGVSYVSGRCYGGWGRENRWGGRGRGFGRFYPTSYPYPNAVQEVYRVSSLEQQAGYLEESLESIRREIAEAKARKGIE